MIKNISFIAMLLAIGAGCNKDKNTVDASGTFESNEVIISSGASGIIKQFDIQEGQVLKAGQFIGYIDTVPLYLKKKQLLAQIHSTLSQKPDINKQLAALEVQLAAAQREQHRVTELVKAEAATQKQLDDINAQVQVIQKQIAAQSSSLNINSGSISRQTDPLHVQIEQIDEQLEQCRIINPVNGTVLSKYAEASEMSAVAKPLYKIADLSTLVLRAYITGGNFAKAKLGQTVKVLVDDSKGGYKEYAGTIEWISDKAEFTPKTIQTKDERANLVYAIKIRVKNDGLLKIGMYADVKF
jgi:HlyD family secretion protein